MDKIVGNNRYAWLVVFFALFVATVGHANLRMSAFDPEGNPLRQAGAGQPFTVEIEITGLGNVMQKPAVQTPSAVTMRSIGYHMASINGDTTIKHKYKVVVQTPGTYTIGPAVVEKDGTEYRSEPLTFTVGEQHVAVTPVDLGKKSPAAFLELKVEKDRVVVGEDINCAIRFYFGDEVLQVAPINKPDFSGIETDPEQGPTKGTKEIKNKKYSYLEWRWKARATRAGTVTIPAYSADFTVQSEDEMLKRFGMFVGNVGDQKRVYSNAVSIVVDELPAHDGLVHGIGSFSRMNAQIKPAHAKEGEGMVMTIEVEGQGSINAKNCAQLLQELPAEFKYYESKQYTNKKNDENQTRYIFEFIVQGLKAGSYEIPRQQFTFFDSNVRRYKTLESIPMQVTITPSATLKHQKHYEQPQEQTPTIDGADELQPVHPCSAGQAPWYTYVMPWWLFVMFTFLPVLYVLVYRKKNMGCLWRINNLFERKKTAAQRVYTALAQARRTHNFEQVYHAFQNYFAQKLGITVEEITDTKIIDYCTARGFSVAEITEWQNFYTAMTEQLFFAKQSMRSRDQEQLLNQADRWLTIFEKMGGGK